MKPKVSLSKPLVIFDVFLIIVGIITIILMFTDHQHFLFYRYIPPLIAFLSFLAKGIYFFRRKEYKMTIISFLIVILSIALIYLNNVIA